MKWEKAAAAAAAVLVLGCAGSSPAGLVINEIKWMGDFEWIELYNYGHEEVDLAGYELMMDAPPEVENFPPVKWNRHTVIPPYGYYLICDSNDQDEVEDIVNVADRRVPLSIDDESDDAWLLLLDLRTGDAVDWAITRYEGAENETPMERIDPSREGWTIRNWVVSRTGGIFRDGAMPAGLMGTPAALNSYTPRFQYRDGVPDEVEEIDEHYHECIFPQGTDAVPFWLEAGNGAAALMEIGGFAWPRGGILIEDDRNNVFFPRMLVILTTSSDNTVNGPFRGWKVVWARTSPGPGKFDAVTYRRYVYEVQQGDGCGIVPGGAAAGGNALLIGLAVLSLMGARLIGRRRAGG